MKTAFRLFGLLAPLFTTDLAQAAPADLDPAFGNGGITAFGLPASPFRPYAVQLQPDGKLLVAGSTLQTTPGGTATLNAMLAQGWVFEGEANTKVFASVPQ